jgi:AraC-like DNA-binding protein
MDFLESAEIWIPALTNIPVTIYAGEPDVLRQFEKNYCFFTDIQEIFTAKALENFCGKRQEDLIYEIKEPMGSQLILLNVKDAWVLLGPYVHSPWNEKNARRRFARFHIPESEFLSYQGYRNRLPVVPEGSVFKIAFLLLEHTVGNGFSHEIKVIEMHPVQNRMNLSPMEIHEDSHVVNQRYEWENRLIKAVSHGETQKALELLQTSKADMTGLRFISDDMRDQLAGAAIMRTLVRKAAEQAGLTPVLIDAISQDYAVQMQQATSARELNFLQERLIIHFCGMIRQHLRSEYSVYVKKATQFIDVNLGRPITAAELAGIAGISADYLVKKFCQETGMTIKQYLAKRRCEVAADLLTESEISIQEIAAYVGYEDNSYFTRVFKEKMGVSPQKYRTGYRQNEK